MLVFSFSRLHEYYEKNVIGFYFDSRLKLFVFLFTTAFFPSSFFLVCFQMHNDFALVRCFNFNRALFFYP